MFKRFLLVFVVGLLPYLANAASFDCNKASTDIEKMICRHDDLSAADEKLAEAYKIALSNASNASSKESVKKEQRAWIKKRDQLMPYQPTLLSTYQERIEELSNNSAANEPTSTDSKNAGTKPSESSASSKTGDTSVSQSASPTSTKEKSFVSEHLLIVIVSLLIVIIAMYAVGINLQSKGSLNIFVDYSDALLTMLAVLIPLLLLLFTNESNASTKFFVVLIFIAFMFFPIKSAFIYNNTVGMALLSLGIKFFTSFMYILGIYFIITGGGGSKKENESQVAYELRLQREKASQTFWMAVHHMILVWIVYKTARINSFTGEIFHFSFNNRFDQLMLAVAEQDEED